MSKIYDFILKVLRFKPHFVAEYASIFLDCGPEIFTELKPSPDSEKA